MGVAERISALLDQQLTAATDVSRMHLQLLDDGALYDLANAIKDGGDLRGFNILLGDNMHAQEVVNHLAAESVIREYTRRRDIAGLNELYG